eukprot:CAMPEP_0119525258 /NCGR_PEP_ID=MMETSP1344-20130328/40088_1 /TAXON_ID=236787 /ORGANISM="Florenciella parvula, Strain CCMP2471" /LENGTH=235 /DNA_ID=CAMNT_0007563999 /DNA_START=27 /DNA_END=731 /DNA_ORIENTATION=-
MARVLFFENITGSAHPGPLAPSQDYVGALVPGEGHSSPGAGPSSGAVGGQRDQRVLLADRWRQIPTPRQASQLGERHVRREASKRLRAVPLEKLDAVIAQLTLAADALVDKKPPKRLDRNLCRVTLVGGPERLGEDVPRLGPQPQARPQGDSHQEISFVGCWAAAKQTAELVCRVDRRVVVRADADGLLAGARLSLGPARRLPFQRAHIVSSEQQRPLRLAVVLDMQKVERHNRH